MSLSGAGSSVARGLVEVAVLVTSIGCGGPPRETLTDTAGGSSGAGGGVFTGGTIPTAGACVPDGAPCGGDVDCCSGACDQGLCVSACVDVGGACAQDTDCCPEQSCMPDGTGATTCGFPSSSSCGPAGAPCGADGECCSASCDTTQLMCN